MDRSVDSVPVPTGVLQLLRLASVDGGFKAKLLCERSGVAPAAGVALTKSEAAIVDAVSDAQLSKMVDSLPPPPAARRQFLRATAAGAVVLLGGAALASCGEEIPGRPEHRGTVTDGGVAPHMPEPRRPDHPEVLPAGGAAPDMPPPGPTPHNPQHQGEPDPPKPPEPVIPLAGAMPDVPNPARGKNRPMVTTGGMAPDIGNRRK